MFLLTPSARYFYDGDAIAEPAEWARWGDQDAGKYDETIDRVSAYEKLRGRADAATNNAATPQAGSDTQGDGGLMGGLNDVLFGSTGPRGARHDGLVQTMAKTAARTVGSSLGKEILRGVMGSLFGGGKRR